MKKPESTHFHKPTTNTIYLSVFVGSIAILIFFAYVSYLAYNSLLNTQFIASSYLLISPVVIAVLFFILLVLSGKLGLSKELAYLRQYKHPVK